MQIILIGGPACGKTTLGKMLAAARGYSFLDTDQWIEAEAQKSIPQIFAEEGEAVFRAWETQSLQNCLKIDHCVIATGGGIIKLPENREILAACPCVIYLNVSITRQLKRTQKDTSRPLLLGQNKEAILIKLRNERDPLYRSVATCIVDVNASAAATVKKIQQALEDTRNIRGN